MLIFYDSEFSDFLDPRLISIGFVSEDGTCTFYAELTSTYQPSDGWCRKRPTKPCGEVLNETSYPERSAS